MLELLKNIINIITIVLVVFSLISLIVSSIMISIITNMRVLERTKDIGILRSIGKSRKTISRLFNIENILIGIISSIISSNKIGVELCESTPTWYIYGLSS